MKKRIRIALLTALAACGLCACAQTAPPPPQITAAPEEFFSLPGEVASGRETSPVVISEVMVHNQSALMAPDGSFPDWIELYNPSDAEVPLEGLILADQGDAREGTVLSGPTLPPGGYALVFADAQTGTKGELHVPFRLSDGESVYLFDASGRALDRVDLGETEEDCSLARDGENFAATAWPSPGYPNSAQGFADFQRERGCRSDLRIYEVKVSPYGEGYSDNVPNSDWVELYNAGKEPVSTLGYALSDSKNEPERYPLPKATLQPGKRMLILCGAQAPQDFPIADLSLDSGRESLYLSYEGQIVDYASLHDIPCSGSYGRLEGEEGFFYFSQASLNAPNEGPHARQIAPSPLCEEPDGVFEGVKEVTVTLSGEGELHYTLDGSLPDESSPVYTGPLKLRETCVVRAVAVKEGCLPSRALNLSYILNEGHTMPVVSIMGDKPERLTWLLNWGSQSLELPGAVCLYENGQRAFSTGCGLSLSGLTSIELAAKKNVRVNLRGCYGEQELGYDLFGDGCTDRDSFILRGGQDSALRLMSTEIWQNLCLEMTDRVMTQHSKYCVVYVNGEYYGIYVLKENIGAKMYARWAGVDRESVLSTIPHVTDTPDYIAMYEYICGQDMADPEKYARACELLDMDSFIDWTILEGVSGNFDLFRNVRFFRSTEKETGYQLALFDLDNTLGETELSWECLFGSEGVAGYPNTNVAALLRALLKSPDFREHFLRRYGEVYDTALSNDRVMAEIDRLEALLLPEIERDRQRWGMSVEAWQLEIANLRHLIRDHDRQNYCVDRLNWFVGMSREERANYFGLE